MYLSGLHLPVVSPLQGHMGPLCGRKDPLAMLFFFLGRRVGSGREGERAGGGRGRVVGERWQYIIIHYGWLASATEFSLVPTADNDMD